jgi:HD superfamily phosphodiesterase
MPYFSKHPSELTPMNYDPGHLDGYAKDVLTSEVFWVGQGDLSIHDKVNLREHLLNVGHYAVRIAQMLGATEKEIEETARAALLHDFAGENRNKGQLLSFLRKHGPGALEYGQSLGFAYSENEQRAVKNHMWPIDGQIRKGRPRSKVEAAVMMADRFSATMEAWHHRVRSPMKNKARLKAQKVRAKIPSLKAR